MGSKNRNIEEEGKTEKKVGEFNWEDCGKKSNKLERG